MENQQQSEQYTQNDENIVIPKQNNFSNTQFINIPCNVQFARRIKNIYAGKYSAFSNFAIDTYGQIVFLNPAPQVAEILSKIVLDDIAHINTLGGIIGALGCNARFTNGQGTPWSARYLNYPHTPALLLNLIIKHKQQFEVLLQNIKQSTSSQGVASHLDKILLDTQRHISSLQAFLTTI